MASTGTIRLTADSVIGVSGKPVRIYFANWISGLTAGDLVLRNGTGAGDDIYIQQTGTISNGHTQEIHNGLLFPSGCFYDHDTNTTQAVLSYEVVRVT